MSRVNLERTDTTEIRMLRILVVDDADTCRNMADLFGDLGSPLGKEIGEAQGRSDI
jgi:hypothetical protein